MNIIQKGQHALDRYPTAAPCFVLTIMTVLSLAPFLNKAVHLDDTIFLVTTREILAGNPRPLDATLNWYGSPMRLSELNKNPPLVSYLMAPVVAIAGWSERALHAAFLFPAIGAILGTFFVARHLCNRPMLAALLVLFSPAFLVSATNLMPDVPMFCLWVWAIAIWLGALKREQRWEFILAGACIALAALCKYSAIALIPLLAITGMTPRKWPTQLCALLIPLAALAIFEIFTAHHYGQGLIHSAVTYSSQIQEDRAPLIRMQLLAGPCFTGGCFLGAAMFLPMACGRRFRILAICLAGGLFIALFSWPQMLPLKPATEPNRTLATWHVLIFGLAGIGLLCAAGADVLRCRDRQSLLLAAWVFGVFTFTAVVNWSANARSILPMAPAIVIVAIRALDRSPAKPNHRAWFAVPVVISAIISLLLATADTQMANASRQAAGLIHDRARTFHGTLWFDGHWGFQWYMEQHGAVAMDYDNALLPAGDLLVQPQNNSNVHPMPMSALRVTDDIQIPVLPFVATINEPCSAEFYSSFWGPLPYAFGPKTPEDFIVFRITQNILPPTEKPSPASQATSATASQAALGPAS